MILLGKFQTCIHVEFYNLKNMAILYIKTSYCVFLPGFRNGALIPTISLLVKFANFNTNLMASVCKFLYHIIVTVFVRYEECTFNETSVRIFLIVGKHFLIVIIIILIQRSVKCQQYHLRPPGFSVLGASAKSNHDIFISQQDNGLSMENYLHTENVLCFKNIQTFTYIQSNVKKKYLIKSTTCGWISIVSISTDFRANKGFSKINKFKIIDGLRFINVKRKRIKNSQNKPVMIKKNPIKSTTS
ncbi:hypothetical protein AGLY_000001 [Aphis glycines]|uniref:Uncharacterized protein n=1 Tax=Aphis glycines TaxID=307491 RepID=A0A6G0U6Q7_APHGL|nr:hypothetical protein AGLY_000001 [Aphis glycines]